MNSNIMLIWFFFLATIEHLVNDLLTGSVHI